MAEQDPPTALPRPGDVLREALPWIGFAIAVMALEVVVHLTTDISYQRLVVDASELSDEVQSVAGAVTTLGVVLWVGATIVAWFARWVVGPTSRLAPVLLWVGGWSLLMGLDDRLRIHEDLSDALGTSEAVVIAPLLVLAGWIAWRHGGDLRPEWGLAFLAGVGLGTSLFVDQVVEVVLGTEVGGVVFVEENAKLLGIVLWFATVLHLSRRAIVDRA